MTSRTGNTLLWLAVAAGLLLRGYHYARNPAVWHDEAAMIANVLRSPAAVFGPLLYDNATPPLFLLLEMAVVAGLGDSEYALRLPSFVAACLSVLFSAFAARRLLPHGWAAVAVGLVAVSDRLLWHACEAKPYSVDVCVAAAAIWFVVSGRWSAWGKCLLAAVVAPACLWVSYPACFVAGGVLVAVLPAAWREGWRGRGALALFAAGVGASFLLLALGPAAAQRTGNLEACWGGAFADWSHPDRVPGWAAVQWFEVVRYCFIPWGWPLLLPAVLGWWSWRRTAAGWACGLPMALTFVASLLGKYPFDPARTVAFLAPGLALLVGEGLRRLWGWFAHRAGWRWGLLVWAGVLLASAGWTAYRVVQPWPRLQTREAAAVVLTERREGEPVYANYWEFHYLLRSLPRTHLQVEEPSSPGWEESRREWLKASPPRVWVVHGDPAGGAFPYQVPDGYTLGRRWEFGEVRVWELTK